MSFKKSIFYTFVTKVMVSLLGLILVILVSRNLGAEGRGEIGIFMSSVALLQLFCDFGNSTAIINLSYTHSRRRLWFSSLIWVFMICALGVPVVYFFRDFRFSFLIPPAAFLFSVINLHQLILMGMRKVGMRNLSLLVMPVLMIPCFLIAYFHLDMGILSYTSALFIALSVSALISRFFLWDALKPDGQALGFEKEILRQGVWVQSAQAVQFLNYRINFFIVVFFLGEAALGIFNNAVILAEAIWILGHSMGQIQHLKILNSSDEKMHILLTRKLMLYNGAGSLMLCLILYIIPNHFWIFLFSDDFTAMRGLFIYLFPGVICFSISNMIGHFLHAKGYFRKILLCNSMGLISGLVFSMLFIPVYGLSAAAWSWSLGLAVSMLFYLRYFKIISAGIFKKN